MGFSAYLIAHGLTTRGVAQRTGAHPYVLMDPQTLARTICKASGEALADLFNGTVRLLAAAHVFPPLVMAAVDGSKIPTTAHYQGCGQLPETRHKRRRDGRWVEVVEFFGWWLIALADLVTLIPLAIKIVPIQEHEDPHLLALLAQAQQNLAPYSRIVSLVADRAHVDGATLYQVAQQGIRWYLMAKANMTARHPALALSAEGTPQVRLETVRHGHGCGAVAEQLHTEITPGRDIHSWAVYRPAPVAGERLAWADRPALNAVVVTMWRNELPDSQTGPWMILNNDSVETPWTLVDAYDDHSWIENGLFRNSKQFWTLPHWFPEKTEAGVRAHLTFVMLMLATAYRLWDKAQSDTPQPTASHLARPTPSVDQGTPLPEPRACRMRIWSARVPNAGGKPCAASTATNSLSLLATLTASLTPTSLRCSPACPSATSRHTWEPRPTCSAAMAASRQLRQIRMVICCYLSMILYRNSRD